MAKLFIFFLLIFQGVLGANILGIFFIPSISHQTMFQPIWKELSLRGHKVTVISPNILNDPTLVNLTEIDVNFVYRILREANFAVNISMDNFFFKNVMFIMHTLCEITEAELQHEEVKKLINNDQNHFDVILLEGLNPLIYGFGAKFKAPVISITSLPPQLQTHDSVGNPTHPVISPDVMLNIGGDLSYRDRIKSLFFNICYRMVYYWYFVPNADKTARKYFGNHIPYLGDVERNTSLLIVNVNPVMRPVRPNVPNVIEVSGLHIKQKRALPKDLQEYLDSSHNGAVLFSLGTNVFSSHLSPAILKTIVDALAELPYNVIWKWENDYLPGQPSNVLVRKWLPQQDILGHPNIKAFVTQGGLQSIEEAIMNEIPMLGIPFIADQLENVKRISDLGMGATIDHERMTKDQLKNAIMQVAENRKYVEQVKKYKAVLVDHPMTGLEKTIWWIEYVIRHRGAAHLRSPAADMSFFEYFMLDVITVLIAFICIVIYIVRKIYSRCMRVQKLKIN